jgi:hypothetical protein
MGEMKMRKQAWLSFLAIGLIGGCSFVTDFDPSKVSSGGSGGAGTGGSSGMGSGGSSGTGGSGGPTDGPRDAAVDAPQGCVHNSDCNDDNKCTDDLCVGGSCLHSTVACNDGLGCTTDSCDPQVGCVHTPDDTRCDDQLDCTVDMCDTTLGCVHTPNDALCDDGDPCTQDTCVPRGTGNAGCQHTHIAGCQRCGGPSDCPNVCLDCPNGEQRSCSRTCTPNGMCAVTTCGICLPACVP